MIQTTLNGMITLMLVKFMFNDVPHASGMLANPEPVRKPTPGQLRYIAILCQQLTITRPYEGEVKSFGEAGRMISELKVEKAYRKQSKGSTALRVERTSTDKIIDDLERTWHRIESDTTLEMQSALMILKEVMGYYYLEPCVVVWRGSNLVGIAIYETYDDADLGTRETHIKELASFSHVSGIGRLLVQEVIKIARGDGAQNVTLSYGAGAKGFYEKLGFTEDRRLMPEGEVGTLMMYKL